MSDLADVVIFIVECFGVISFAISAAIVSIGKRADIIGVLVLSEITIFGGGILRDLILGITPPHAFWDKEYIFLAILTAVVATVCYVLAFFRRSAAFLDRQRNSFVLYLFDAIGLAIYCVCGIDVAIEAGYGDNVWLLIYVGCVTGVGGGVLRDTFSCEIPMVFRKRVYLLPTICGATLYVFLYGLMPHLLAMLIAIGFILIFRILAIVFHWNLPTPPVFQ